MFRRVVCFVSADFDKGIFKCFTNFTTTTVTRGDLLSEHRNNSYQPVADFYAGKSVLITGGSGFLGKVFIERLLYNCTEIDKIFVLLREKRGSNINQRLQNITDNPLFSKLKETRPNALDKIVPITGDMESKMLGIKNDDQRTILENVSVIFHSAAEVRFHKPLQFTLKINVEGTRELLNLCHRMNKIEAFVYVSTAYSQAERIQVDEVLYPPPHKLGEVYKLLENNNSPEEIKQILKGKLNTYTYSKAMSEALVAEEHGNIPAIIVRPSIAIGLPPITLWDGETYGETWVKPFGEYRLGSMLGEPLPGWLDNWNGGTGLLYDFGRGVNNVLHGNKETVTDMIPVDYTINLAIAAASKCSDKNDVKVYNSCTSLDNPITCGGLEENCKEAFRKLNNDKHVPKIYFFKSPWMVSLVSTFYLVMPAHAADFWLRCRGKEPRYVKELKGAIARRDLLRNYTSISMFWKTNNTRRLFASLSPEDKRRFPFDPTDIAWDKYLDNYIKGIYKYLIVKKK